jgi:hypothetical protein
VFFDVDVDKSMSAYLLVVSLHMYGGVPDQELKKILGGEQQFAKWLQDNRHKYTHTKTQKLLIKTGTRPASQKGVKEIFKENLGTIRHLLEHWKTSIPLTSDHSKAIEDVCKAVEKPNRKRRRDDIDPDYVPPTGNSRRDDGQQGDYERGLVYTLIIEALYNNGAPRSMCLEDLNNYNPTIREKLDRGSRGAVWRLVNQKKWLRSSGMGKYELTEAGIEHAKAFVN